MHHWEGCLRGWLAFQDPIIRFSRRCTDLIDNISVHRTETTLRIGWYDATLYMALDLVNSLFYCSESESLGVHHSVSGRMAFQASSVIR